MSDLPDLARSAAGALDGIRASLQHADELRTWSRPWRVLRDSLSVALLLGILVGVMGGSWVIYEQLRSLATWATQADKALATALSYQRAWLGPTGARVDGTLEVGKPATVRVDYANSGREPAVDLAYGVDVLSVAPKEEANLQPFFKRCNETAPTAGQVIFPGMGLQLSAVMKAELADKPLVDGDKTLVLAGCFIYRTAASEAIRRTFFCYAYNAKQSRQGAMGLCNVGNAAN